MNNFLVYRNKIRSGVRPVIGHPINIDHFLTQGLVGHWTFNEGAGSYAYDYSGHNNTGTLYNGPTWTTLSTNEKVLSFDGTDDYVDCGNKPEYNVAQSGFSLIAWIKAEDPISSGGDGRIIKRWTGGYPGAGYSLCILKTSGRIITETRSDGTPNGYCLTSPTTPSYFDGKWHFIVSTTNVQQKSVHLYVDGNLVSSGGNWGGNLLDLNSNLYIGTMGATSFNYMYKGSLDDVRLYNRALSAGEIQYLYTKTQARYK